MHVARGHLVARSFSHGRRATLSGGNEALPKRLLATCRSPALQTGAPPPSRPWAPRLPQQPRRTRPRPCRWPSWAAPWQVSTSRWQGRARAEHRAVPWVDTHCCGAFEVVLLHCTVPTAPAPMVRLPLPACRGRRSRGGRQADQWPAAGCLRVHSVQDQAQPEQHGDW